MKNQINRPLPNSREQIATTDPSIQKWYKQLQAVDKDAASMNIVDFMNKQKGQGIYDYGSAISAGNRPIPVKYDKIMHWSDTSKLPNNPNLHNQLDSITAKQ